MSDQSTERGPKSLSLGRRLWRSLRYDRLATIALLVLAVIVASAIVPTLFTTHDPLQQEVVLRNSPPMTEPIREGEPTHILGTDQLGRDVYSRLIHGTRVSLTVALAGVAVAGTIGTGLGLLAGYTRGRLDDVISRIIDVQMGLPALLVALFVLFALGPGFGNLVLVMSVVRWPIYARVARGVAMSVREADFVLAARAIGVGKVGIVVRHVLPRITSPMIIVGTVELSRLILMESSLSFLGLGIQPPTPSWGLMIAESRLYIRSAWWAITFPGLAILVTALSANLVASWLRGVTDPDQRWRWTKAARTKSSE